MHLLAPDLLEPARGLSMAVCVTGLVLGLLLWLYGWRAHRFWIVLVTTLTAGVLGLYSGSLHGLPPLVAGLLLAIAAGMLGLALARLLAFASGGAAACLLVRTLAPTWDEPYVYFLAGGLLGVVLFRLWTMALTSLGGTLLMAYSGLCLLDRLGKLNAVALTQTRPNLLDWGCAGVALMGVGTQIALERRRARQATKQKEAEKAEVQKLQQELAKRSQQKTWWDWATRQLRRAG
jgi:hypothetical protein